MTWACTVTKRLKSRPCSIDSRHFFGGTRAFSVAPATTLPVDTLNADCDAHRRFYGIGLTPR